MRFRVLLPLEAALACVDRAAEAWRVQFARVWDRLPLRVGVVAFSRMMPFQAVIEAARNIESDLEGTNEEAVGTWIPPEAAGAAPLLGAGADAPEDAGPEDAGPDDEPWFSPPRDRLASDAEYVLADA